MSEEELAVFGDLKHSEESRLGYQGLVATVSADTAL
jgi:hypothetical protein